MTRRCLVALASVSVVTAAAWVAGRGGDERWAGGWVQVAPGVLRSPGLPAGYALVSGERALLIDAPHGPTVWRHTASRPSTACC